MKFDGKAGSLQGIDQQVHDRITKNHGLVAYSDASWHDTDELGYDMFGYVIYFAGGPVAFTSKRIKVVAKSSAEAEYAAASYTCMELTFVRNILGDLGYPIQAPIVICVDNKAAVDICKSC